MCSFNAARVRWRCRADRIAATSPSKATQRANLDQLRIRERLIRSSIAVFVPLFGLAGVLDMASDGGPSTPLRAAVAGTVLATTIPVGLLVARMHLGSMWLAYRDRFNLGPAAFVAYADVGVIAVLACFDDHKFALTGTALLAIVSAYSAHFVTRLVRVCHFVASAAAVVLFAVWTVATDGDAAGVAAEACCLLLVIIGPSTVVSIFTSDVRSEWSVTFMQRITTRSPVR